MDEKRAALLMQGASPKGNAFAKYFTQIQTKAPHLCKSDVMAYRDYILKHGPKLNVPDSPKNNKTAAKIRLEANHLLNMGDLGTALHKYHESICWARNGSTNLAMGYGNWYVLHFGKLDKLGIMVNFSFQLIDL